MGVYGLGFRVQGFGSGFWGSHCYKYENRRSSSRSRNDKTATGGGEGGARGEASGVRLRVATVVALCAMMVLIRALNTTSSLLLMLTYGESRKVGTCAS